MYTMVNHLWLIVGNDGYKNIQSPIQQWYNNGYIQWYNNGVDITTYLDGITIVYLNIIWLIVVNDCE